MSLTTRQWGIVGLTMATALIHLVLALGNDGFFLIAFLLNAVGYVALVAGLYFLPQFAERRPSVRWGLLGFTAVTFILYFVFNWPDVWGPIGLIDKAIELVLIIMLWLDN